jgi:hypothetical protein
MFLEQIDSNDRSPSGRLSNVSEQQSELLNSERPSSGSELDLDVLAQPSDLFTISKPRAKGFGSDD